MNKEEFEENYCKNSNITRDYYNENFVTLPCGCGSDLCEGWTCVSNNPLSIKTHNELYMKRL